MADFVALGWAMVPSFGSNIILGLGQGAQKLTHKYAVNSLTSREPTVPNGKGQGLPRTLLEKLDSDTQEDETGPWSCTHTTEPKTDERPRRKTESVSVPEENTGSAFPDTRLHVDC